MKMASAASWSPLPYASNAGPACWKKASPRGHREQRQLQQDQRVHGLGMVERQLGGDRGAARVAGDVGARHAEVVEERGGVGGVVGDAHRGWGVGAADPTPLVVADQLVAVGQRRLLTGAAGTRRPGRG